MADRRKKAARRVGGAEAPTGAGSALALWDSMSDEERARWVEDTRILSSEEWHALGKPDRLFTPDLSKPKVPLDQQPADIRESILRHRDRMVNRLVVEDGGGDE